MRTRGADTALTPGERSAQILDYVDVLDALCDLDRVERAALRLIYWHGCTQAQVAAELHLPPNIVPAVVAHGMRCVADRLTDRPPGSVPVSDKGIDPPPTTGTY